MPCSRPPGSSVPKAVVAGSSTPGSSSRTMDSSSNVSSPLPLGKSRKGVSFWLKKGPMPTMWGPNSLRKRKSRTRSSSVW